MAMMESMAKAERAAAVAKWWRRAEALREDSLRFLRSLPYANQQILLRSPKIGDFFHVYLFAEMLEALGRHIGRSHRVGSRRLSERRPTITADEYGYAARDYLLANDFIPQDIRDAYESVATGLLNDMHNILNCLLYTSPSPRD